MPQTNLCNEAKAYVVLNLFHVLPYLKLLILPLKLQYPYHLLSLVLIDKLLLKDNNNNHGGCVRMHHPTCFIAHINTCQETTLCVCSICAIHAALLHTDQHWCIQFLRMHMFLFQEQTVMMILMCGSLTEMYVSTRDNDEQVLFLSNMPTSTCSHFIVVLRLLLWCARIAIHSMFLFLCMRRWLVYMKIWYTKHWRDK